MQKNLLPKINVFIEVRLCDWDRQTSVLHEQSQSASQHLQDKPSPGFNICETFHRYGFLHNNLVVLYQYLSHIPHFTSRKFNPDDESLCFACAGKFKPDHALTLADKSVNCISSKRVK